MTQPEVRFEGFEREWVPSTIRELADEVRGGGTPNTSVPDYWQGEIPWIQSSDVKEDQLFGLVPKKGVTAAGIAASAAARIPADSIAVVSRVGVGKLAHMPFEYATSQDFVNLSGLDAEPEFVAYSLRQTLRHAAASAQGSVIKGLTTSEILNLELLLPEHKEQQAIGSYFRELDTLINSRNDLLAKLRNVKATLQSKMFV